MCIRMARAESAGSAILGLNHGQIQPFSGICTIETLRFAASAAFHALYEMPASS